MDTGTDYSEIDPPGKKKKARKGKLQSHIKYCYRVTGRLGLQNDHWIEWSEGVYLWRGFSMSTSKYKLEHKEERAKLIIEMWL